MKSILIFLSFLSISSFTFALTGETGRFAYDDVEYFISEEEERIGAYTLEIKGIPYSYTYTVIREEDKYYFPLFEFIEALGIKNYTFKDGVLEIIFGDNNDKRIIDLKKLDKSSYLYEDNDFFLEEKLFKEYFFEEFRLNEEDYIIKTSPNFVLPVEMKYILANREKELKEELQKDVLYYKGERELFDIGNLRVNLEKEINNNTGGTEKKYDWSGFLEYSGSLLYGNFITDYDLKEKEFGDFELNYYGIKEDYELSLGIYGDDREKGITFRRDRGYSLNEGREYIIEERVPIGSKVELLYNLFPIDVQDESGGKVTFVNSLIKSGREFVLKIYEQNGKITERVIKINEDYNQQEKGEFGYDIYIREDKESDKSDADINIFYGYTDNLTFGFSYNHSPEMFEENWILSKEMGTELIYSNSLEGNPFTLSYEFTHGLNHEENENESYKHKYRHRYFMDTDIKKLSLNYEQYDNGVYYDEKREIYIDADYDLTEDLTITGSLENIKYHTEDREDETDYYYGLEYSKSFNTLLVSYEVEKNQDNETRHGLDFYYTGFRDFTVRFENTLDEEDNYEAELRINNTRWMDNLDFSMGMKYSEDKKVEYVLEFVLKFDNWLEFGSLLEKNGNKRTYVGIDRVVNLKNPMQNMNSLENTVVRAIAFLDRNDNNKFDKDEERISDVEITLGQKKVLTDENGEACIYGIPSYSDYELTAQSRRPSHDGRAARVKVRGLGSSEIKAYIPIKPLITFTGDIEFKKDQSAVSDVRIKLNKISENESGKIIYPESSGEFYIDSLTPGKYKVEIEYFGDEYNIPNKVYETELLYTDENAGENYQSFELKEEAEQ